MEPVFHEIQCNVGASEHTLGNTALFSVALPPPNASASKDVNKHKACDVAPACRGFLPVCLQHGMTYHCAFLLPLPPNREGDLSGSFRPPGPPACIPGQLLPVHRFSDHPTV